MDREYHQEHIVRCWLFLFARMGKKFKILVIVLQAHHRKMRLPYAYIWEERGVLTDVFLEGASVAWSLEQV